MYDSGSQHVTGLLFMKVSDVPFNQDSATQNIIWFRITDTSSNQNQTLPTVIKVDTEWPQIISAIDLNATIFSGNETINFTVTNKIGPVQVWYNWNNGDNISLTSPYNSRYR